ncbi:uncharacterized protein LOC143254606 [Tachypleus tridentatus]|uniref:uncharacterized protein LOC143254606 n=1 Tax=Tachypleus tridentatus TaxID=6853 RepID=UPI003FD22255
MAITESLMKEGKSFVTMATKQSFEIYSQKCVSPPLRFNGTASIIEMPNGHGKLSGSSTLNEKGGFEDDELTNLTWLQDTNLLKNIHMGSCGEAESILNDSQTGDLFQDAVEDGSDKTEGSTESPFSSKSTLTEPYNPQVHINAKPPYSFSCLIFMAIEDSPVKALAVKDIYSWILTHFPYFQNAPTGWKNSVRHNLSLNKCFSKVDKIKGQNIGKGSLWCIDSQFRPNLLQALRKSPSSTFSHMPSLDYILRFSQSKANNTCAKSLPLAPTLSNNLPSPELFPYLSKRLNVSTVKDPEVDAAATMLALKNGPCVPDMNSKSCCCKNGPCVPDMNSKSWCCKNGPCVPDMNSKSCCCKNGPCVPDMNSKSWCCKNGPCVPDMNSKSCCCKNGPCAPDMNSKSWCCKNGPCVPDMNSKSCCCKNGPCVSDMNSKSCCCKNGPCVPDMNSKSWCCKNGPCVPDMNSKSWCCKNGPCVPDMNSKSCCCKNGPCVPDMNSKSWCCKNGPCVPDMNSKSWCCKNGPCVPDMNSKSCYCKNGPCVSDMNSKSCCCKNGPCVPDMNSKSWCCKNGPCVPDMNSKSWCCKSGPCVPDMNSKSCCCVNGPCVSDMNSKSCCCKNGPCVPDMSSKSCCCKNGPCVPDMNSKSCCCKNGPCVPDMNSKSCCCKNGLCVPNMNSKSCCCLCCPEILRNVTSGKYGHNETPVVTNSPSEDHNYSASLAVSSCGEDRTATLRVDTWMAVAWKTRVPRAAVKVARNPPER